MQFNHFESLAVLKSRHAYYRFVLAYNWFLITTMQSVHRQSGYRNTK